MSFAHSGSITRVLAYQGEAASAAHRPRPPAVLPGKEDFDTREGDTRPDEWGR